MAGIYFHIPFCKSKCTYCDFFKITDFTQQEELYTSMLLELEMRKDELHAPVETIYFGGGTPSTFPSEKISGLLKGVGARFNIMQNAEITVEANPDDLDDVYLSQLRHAGVNRLSIGIQSFNDEQLKFINRRHTSRQAVQTILMAQEAGFDNISIDLIYGLPHQDMDSWKEQVQMAMQLNIQHISAYGLMYEEETALWRQKEAGIINPADDELMNTMYFCIVNTCKEHGFEQYEISNYAKKGYRSRHNSAYWSDRPYLGIGPAAHSFDKKTRRWNVASVSEYVGNMAANRSFYEVETLSEQDKYNDYVMVALRKIEGIDLKYLHNNFNEQLTTHCLQNAVKHFNTKLLEQTSTHLRLTQQGVLFSDSIIVDLMFV